MAGIKFRFCERLKVVVKMTVLNGIEGSETDNLSTSESDNDHTGGIGKRNYNRTVYLSMGVDYIT